MEVARLTQATAAILTGADNDTINNAGTIDGSSSGDFGAIRRSANDHGKP